MGAKRIGNRKYLFLYLACGVALFVTGTACRSHLKTRPNEEAAVVEHVPSSMETVSQNTSNHLVSPPVSGANPNEHIDSAYLALAEGNYTKAASEIEMASNDDPLSSHPEMIYLTALLYADPDNPAWDMDMACEAFQRIQKEHPHSDRTGEVRIFIDLLQTQQFMQNENQNLRQEISLLKKKLVAEQNSVQRLKSLLNKMKEIDMGLMPEE